MLKKINISYNIYNNFNFSAMSFVKLKSNIKAVKDRILCIHITFNQKNEDLIKIH